MSPGPARRALDIVVAFAALLVLAIPMFVVSIAILLDSKGPVLYKQKRVGQGGRLFTVLKFRTMVVGSSGSMLTAPGDHRVTRVGRFLRAACIDELPQLFNVLAGTMTLVGPRPQTPGFASEYPPECAVVFRYRPGVTGPGVLFLNDDDVLDGHNGDVEAFYLAEVVPQRVALDMEYLEHPTMKRTIGLLLATGSLAMRRALGKPRVAAEPTRIRLDAGDTARRRDGEVHRARSLPRLLARGLAGRRPVSRKP